MTRVSGISEVNLSFKSAGNCRRTTFVGVLFVSTSLSHSCTIFLKCEFAQLCVVCCVSTVE